MATVNEILSQKGRSVLSVGPHLTVLDAAILMNDHKVGCLVVIEAGQLCGIFTERDILRRIVAVRTDPATTLVSDVMTEEVACCRGQTTIEEARSVMKNRRIRHLPVVDEDRHLCGLVSIGDLNAFLTTDQEMTIQCLHEYLYGQAGAYASSA